MNSKYYKFIAYLFSLLVIYFLIQNLINNWSVISHYDFGFNYFYLLTSLIFLVAGLLSLPLIWRLILVSLDQNCPLSPAQAIKIYITSEFGKYVPGKVWALAGKIYLGTRFGISKKVLLIATFLDGVIAVSTTILVGFILFISFFNILPWQLNLITLAIILFAILVIHPKIFYPVFNFLLTKFKRAPLSQELQLPYSAILKFTLYYFLVALITGLSFLFFILSLTDLKINQIPLVIGSFNLAKGLGVAALFAPSGLGVREGILTLSLGAVFAPTVAILISFLARLWATAGEILVYVLALILTKIKNED